MKTRLLAFPLAMIAFFVSCSGGPELGDEAPAWLSSPPGETDSAFRFRGIGSAEGLAAARDLAIAALMDSVIEAMDLGPPARWTERGQSAIREFRGQLESAIRSPEYVTEDGVSVVNKNGWKDPEGGISYAVEISWEKESFVAKANSLADIAGTASSGFRSLEVRAQDAESDGNNYESALIWAAAAGIARENGNTLGYRLALRELERVLASLEYEVQSTPTEALVDLRPAAPAVFRVSSEARAVGNAEFVVGYPNRARDGSPGRGEARVYSDFQGLIVFRPPPVPFAGTQRITLAPSAGPFLEYLDGAADSYSEALTEALETPWIEAVYTASPRARTVPTGILILETDLASNPLASTAAARGLEDDLAADGFDVAVMELDPREMLTRSDRALLRDIKADSRFADEYGRVIHGTVSLESFEQEGDSFVVRVGGTLALSDIQRQVDLHRSVITKTSRAGDGQQAISAAFRQLGRSFAAELIERLP